MSIKSIRAMYLCICVDSSVHVSIPLLFPLFSLPTIVSDDFLRLFSFLLLLDFVSPCISRLIFDTLII